MMIINFGEHKGQSVAELVLRHPGYVIWVLTKPDAEGPLLALRKEILRTIQILDAKPFTRKCAGNNCTALATRFTAYAKVPLASHYWCDSCNPGQAGADKHKLTIGRTYQDVLNHVKKTCGGTNDAYARAVATLAQSKGFPKRYSDQEAERFFETAPT